MAEPTVFANALKIIKDYGFRKNSDFSRHLALSSIAKKMKNPAQYNKFLGMALLDGARSGEASKIYGAFTNGANPNFKTTSGWAALHICVEKAFESKDYFESITLLVSLGADINATNRHGETPLDMAKERWNKPLIGYFNSIGGKSVSTLRL